LFKIKILNEKIESEKTLFAIHLQNKKVLLNVENKIKE